jgi:hypothetical protein
VQKKKQKQNKKDSAKSGSNASRPGPPMTGTGSITRRMCLSRLRWQSAHPIWCAESLCSCGLFFYFFWIYFIVCIRLFRETSPFKITGTWNFVSRDCHLNTSHAFDAFPHTFFYGKLHQTRKSLQTFFAHHTRNRPSTTDGGTNKNTMPFLRLYTRCSFGLPLPSFHPSISTFLLTVYFLLVFILLCWAAVTLLSMQDESSSSVVCVCVCGMCMCGMCMCGMLYVWYVGASH